MEFIIMLAAIIFFVKWISTPDKVEPRTMVKHYRNGYELNQQSNALSQEGWNADSVTTSEDGHILVIYKSTK